MKIYDCFSYLDEDLLLDLRLNILDKFVDYFEVFREKLSKKNLNYLIKGVINS